VLILREMYYYCVRDFYTVRQPQNDCVAGNSCTEYSGILLRSGAQKVMKIRLYLCKLQLGNQWHLFHLGTLYNFS